MSFIVGSQSLLTLTFTQNGVLTDPVGTVQIYLRDPLGNLHTYGIGTGVLHPSTGTYTLNQVWTMDGDWEVRGDAGPGTGQSADETIVTIKRSFVL